MEGKDKAPLPQYRSHKIVGAFKIGQIIVQPDLYEIYFESAVDSYVEVRGQARQRFGKITPGSSEKGYYVRYADGYESWSPTKAFEDGYRLLDLKPGLIKMPPGSVEEAPADPWAHRSTGMKCRTCMWYVEKKAELGRCRRHAPTMNGYPAVYNNDWCGDHKLDENKLSV